MKHTKICFDSIEIIEWYDGIVRAIGKSQLQSYLIVLIKWDTENRKKTYAVFEIDDSKVNQLNDCFESESENTKEEKWNDFQRVFSKIIESYKGSPHFLLEEPKINLEYQTEIGKYEDYLPKILNYDIENVVF